MLRFLYGLSIRHIGIETAKDVANHFGTFEKLWSYLLEELKKGKEVEKEVEEELERKKEKVVENGIKGGLENEIIEVERMAEGEVEEEKEEEKEVVGVIDSQSNAMVSGN